MKQSWKRLFSVILAVAMALSLLPAAALAAPVGSSRTDGVTIDVTDYGADPTGAESSSAAVNAALVHAKTLDASVQKTISFPQGEYHFYAD